MPEDKIREGGREGEALRAALKDDAAVAAAEVVFSRPQTKIGRHKKADHPNPSGVTSDATHAAFSVAFGLASGGPPSFVCVLRDNTAYLIRVITLQ